MMTSATIMDAIKVGRSTGSATGMSIVIGITTMIGSVQAGPIHMGVMWSSNIQSSCAQWIITRVELFSLIAQRGW